MNYPEYKLLDSIDINDIDWWYLSSNTHDGAIDLLKANFDKIDWITLSRNINNKAIELLINNQNKIDWDNLCLNTNDKAIELLKNNPDKINWDALSSNTNDKAIELLEQKLYNPSEINIYKISEDIYDEISKIFINNQNSNILSLNNNQNKLLIKFCEEINNQIKFNNENKINWQKLSKNPNDKAIELLKKNQDKIDWDKLTKNANVKALE